MPHLANVILEYGEQSGAADLHHEVRICGEMGSGLVVANRTVDTPLALTLDEDGTASAVAFLKCIAVRTHRGPSSWCRITVHNDMRRRQTR